jgi:hypothetical protein
MKRVLIKAVLVVAQSSLITIMLGYILFRTQWVVVPAFAAIAILMFIRCSQCGASFRDERVYSKLKVLKFYDTKIIDDCPVCHRPMADRK